MATVEQGFTDLHGLVGHVNMQRIGGAPQVVYHLRGWNLTTQAFERWTGGTPSAPNPSGQPVVGIAIERVHRP